MKTCISRPPSLVLATVACFVMLLTACSFAAVFGPNTVSTEPNKPAETAADSVAVTVNGIDIKESQVDAQLKPQLQKMAAQLPPTFIEQYKKQLRQQVLEKMIIEQLLNEKVKAAKITVTNEEALERIKEIASQQQPPLSMEGKGPRLVAAALFCRYGRMSLRR